MDVDRRNCNGRLGLWLFETKTQRLPKAIVRNLYRHLVMSTKLGYIIVNGI